MANLISLRIEVADLAALDETAERAGMSRSDYIKLAVFSYMRGESEAADLREKLDALAEAQALDRLCLRRSFSLLVQQVCKLTKEDPEALKKLVLGVWGDGE